MGFINWLNKLLNPNHNWTDYDENGNMTGRGFGENLNKLFNPNHNWTDWEQHYNTLDSMKSAFSQGVQQLADPEQITSWVNSQTGAHMTNSEVERNEMQMQNQEDIYQRQVSGMQKAGLNPALMYQSGASSAPSAPAPSQPGLNMSDIMQVMLLGRQRDLIDSQIRNTDAKTDREVEETNRLKLINKYYPELTETQIDKMLTEMGLTREQINELRSRIELQDLEKEMKKLDKIIKEAEANESSEYFKARRELEQAKTGSEKAQAREKVAQAIIEEIEGKFMRENNFKMGSSELLAIAAALANMFNVEGFNGLGTKAFKDWFESFSKPGGMAQTWIEDFLKKNKGSEQR